MSGHAAAVMAAMERADARRMQARGAAHLFVPMPDGRCNLCNLVPRLFVGDRMGPDAHTRADHSHLPLPRPSTVERTFRARTHA